MRRDSHIQQPLPHATGISNTTTSETLLRSSTSSSWNGPEQFYHSTSSTTAPTTSAMHDLIATDGSDDLPASLALPLDHEALLEALVFLDDLELDGDSTGADATVKPEPQLHPMLDTFSVPSASPSTNGLQGTNAMVPADVFASTGRLTPYTTRGGAVDDGCSATTKHEQLQTLPASPPVSVASSTSSPSSPVSSSCGGSCSRTTTTTTTAANNYTNKPKGVVNRSRNRRREELTYLRSMVSELEERLTSVRRRADDQHDAQASRAITGETVADDPVMTAVWEDLAQRQFVQRQRAEVENAKLRRMLEDQIQVGRSLERLLKKRSNNVDELDLQLHGKRARRSSVSISWSNAAIFDELLASIPAMYAQTDAMFAPHSFTRSAPSFRDIQVRTDPENGMLLEVVEAHLFPFAYELTAENYWTLFLMQSANDRFHYHDATIQDDTLTVQFGLTVQVARARGEFNMKVVSRRFTEATRTVIVWTAFCDPTEISETNMDGIYMRHKGWTIIEPILSSDPGSTASSGSGRRCLGTKTTAYSTAIPEAFEDVPDQKRKVGALTNFMLTTTDVQINSRIQQLENRLVELSRESRTVEYSR